MIWRDTGCVGRGGKRLPAKGAAARFAAAAADDCFPRRSRQFQPRPRFLFLSGERKRKSAEKRKKAPGFGYGEGRKRRPRLRRGKAAFYFA